MKKKIIIFMPSIEGGGVEKNLFLVTNYLSNKISKITLITISKKFKNKFNKSIEFKTLNLDLWDRLSRRLKYFLALLLLMKEFFLDKNRLVFSFQANIYCIILCKLFGVKIIVRSNSAPIGWSQNSFKKMIFRIFLNKADQVMVNSLEFKKALKKEFKINAKCIYNPLNKTEIIQKSKFKSKKYFKSKNKLRILNIGRFTEQKDQLTFLKALNLIKDKIEYEAIIVGRGKLKTELENFICKNNLKKKIKIVNFLENPYPIIKETDLFILTSKYEGLPNVLLESLSLNKFVISSNCQTGPKEILLFGKGGLLFQVGDFKELSERILFFIKNRNLCNQKLKFAKHELKRFDYLNNLDKYFNLIKKNL